MPEDSNYEESPEDADPEEAMRQAMLKAHYEHAELHQREIAVQRAEWQSEMREFFDSLSEVQARTLHAILNNIVMDEHARAGGMFILGILASLIWVKFDNVDVGIQSILDGDNGEIHDSDEAEPEAGGSASN